MVTRYTPLILLITLGLTLILIIIPSIGQLNRYKKNFAKIIYNRFHTIKNLTPQDLLESSVPDSIDEIVPSSLPEITSNTPTPPKQTNTIDNKTQEELNKLIQEALVAREKGNLEEAEKSLIEARSIGGNEETLLRIDKQLGDIYFEQGQYIKANSLLKKVISVEEHNHKATRQVGYIYMQQGDPNTAKIFFEKAIQSNQEYPKYYIALVDILYQQELRSEAIYAMEKVHKLRPKNIEYLLSLAELNEQNNNIPKAQYRYTKIIELEPSHPIAKQKFS